MWAHFLQPGGARTREGTLSAKSLSAVTLSGFLLAGCDGTTDPTGIACTADVRDSLRVFVQDGATLERICDATVVAVQGTTTYELRGGGTSPGCGYGGPWEVPGTFELRVDKTGYRPVRLPVTVGRDVCHVITVDVTVNLQRQ